MTVWLFLGIYITFGICFCFGTLHKRGESVSVLAMLVFGLCCWIDHVIDERPPDPRQHIELSALNSTTHYSVVERLPKGLCVLTSHRGERVYVLRTRVAPLPDEFRLDRGQPIPTNEMAASRYTYGWLRSL